MSQKPTDSADVDYTRKLLWSNGIPAELAIDNNTVSLALRSDEEAGTNGIIFNLDKSKIKKVITYGFQMKFKTSQGSFNITFDNVFLADKWLKYFKNMGINSRNDTIPVLLVILLTIIIVILRLFIR